MKRKLIYCTFALTVLLLGGCGQKNNQGVDHSYAPDATPPSTDVTQSTPSPQSNTIQGNNNASNMISEEEAREIALIHAGLTADQVTFVKSGLDMGDNRQNYDVEFYTSDNKEYDYEIDPYTGDILDVDFDAEHYTHSPATLEGESITEEEAKNIALLEVPGATIEDIREFKSNYDNGKLQYEGKIHYEQKEYEFEIDAYSGAILEWDVESIKH